MDINKLEVAAVQEVAAKPTDNGVVELKELELALVGGGCGEVVLG